MQIWKTSPKLRMASSSPHHRTRRLHWHAHAYYELGLVLGGHCDWRLGNRRRLALRTGEAILLKPGVRHCEEIREGGEAHLAWIGFDFGLKAPAWCNRVITLREDAAEIAVHFEAVAREQARRDGRSQARIELALQSLLLLLDRQAEGAPPLKVPRSRLNPRQTRTVESAAHYFRSNLRETLSIAQVAAYHSLCPAHFSSLFRRHHKLTPREFLGQVRLEQAALLLVELELTLKEIATQCGYVDAAHLCHSFKERYRVTPGQFRSRKRLGTGMVLS